jgi:hypothetical protein
VRAIAGKQVETIYAKSLDMALVKLGKRGVSQNRD